MVHGQLQKKTESSNSSDSGKHNLCANLCREHLRAWAEVIDDLSLTKEGSIIGKTSSGCETH
eukprot:CAMPEP_0204630242 /NCGR_PEP_ID=MMETSP0717-20131115/19947_1 /ASSEMBLY_ACC=CAM_ASM_000666 /TAXON_ID=230516 /ORGANISM="Chaetoceros curvisetus" /LENGTH=61 /DNA_ID=CAMNT_0051647433 /DNA_START=446 /DNA_END=631 /DNA_ORIENTATION=+